MVKSVIMEEMKCYH